MTGDHLIQMRVKYLGSLLSVKISRMNIKIHVFKKSVEQLDIMNKWLHAVSVCHMCACMAEIQVSFCIVTNNVLQCSFEIFSTYFVLYIGIN